MSFVRLINVTKKFGSVTAVDHLNIEIEKGECFSILGPSGCGKTTTLRLMAGFEDLSQGEIIVGDRLISSSYKNYYLPPEKRDFGMVFQAFAVWPHLNVFDNIAFPMQIRRISRTDIARRTREALEITGLKGLADVYPHELSGGEKQRIALARALAVNPALLLLDEPLSNLDPQLREEMRFEIKDLQRRFNLAVIYVTHDQAEAMALSDRIMVMSQGVKQQVDTPLNVYNHPANQFVFSFIGLSNFIPVVISGGAIHVEGALDAGTITGDLPGDLSSDRMTIACRPAEIDFVATGGVKGQIKRKAYLGEIVDYRVRVGATEIRIQKQRRHIGDIPSGEECRINFQRILWYGRT
ncbi:MAG: ABC transporter ATP-binding protein [Deltaproteobacteria bacterium]|nr:ABC transporter ATP-binding protein [Deltaproteobacteria bacterium]